MANLNRVTLIGRLSRDPEVRTFGSGGKAVEFGFVVNNRKRNQSGEWEDVPVWLNCKAFDSERGRKLASLIGDTVKKGTQLYIDGRLTYEEWNDKDSGAKRSAIKIIVDDFQYLTPKSEDGGGGGGGRQQNSGGNRQQAGQQPRQQGNGYNRPQQQQRPVYDPGEDYPQRGGDDDIPF